MPPPYCLCAAGGRAASGRPRQVPAGPGSSGASPGALRRAERMGRRGIGAAVAPRATRPAPGVVWAEGLESPLRRAGPRGGTRLGATEGSEGGGGGWGAGTALREERGRAGPRCPARFRASGESGARGGLGCGRPVVLASPSPLPSPSASRAEWAGLCGRPALPSPPPPPVFSSV